MLVTHIRQWFTRGVALAMLCSQLHCGAARHDIPDDTDAAPTNGSGVPIIPIEVPAEFQLPKRLAISVAAVSALEGTAATPTTLDIPGANALAQSLYVVEQDNERIDAILQHLATVHAPTATTTVTASGVTSAGSAWTLDFSPFDFPQLPSAELAAIDCAIPCSGNAAQYPLCVRIAIDGQRVWFGKMLAPVTAESSGAGCFYTVSTVTEQITESSLFDGSESYLLAGRWDAQDTAQAAIEYFSATTIANGDALQVVEHHAVVDTTSIAAAAEAGDAPASAKRASTTASTTASADIIITARASGSVLGADTTTTLAAIHRWQSDVDRAKYTLAGASTESADGCFNLTTGAMIGETGCANLSITNVTVPEAAGPPLLTEDDADDATHDDAAAEAPPTPVASPTVSASPAPSGETAITADPAPTPTPTPSSTARSENPPTLALPEASPATRATPTPAPTSTPAATRRTQAAPPSPAAPPATENVHW